MAWRNLLNRATLRPKWRDSTNRATLVIAFIFQQLL
jgi:hypothetical protein